VLASGRNRMRIAARGFADTIELKRSGPDWITADRERVEIEFIMPRSSESQVPLEQERVMSFANAN
jgi:hypothetical protein